ncbi:chemotaxis protein CheA [Halanaerobium sp. Z-7514]|uniref:Chemotaxis protein CheA n=1 Tax=Halanaerobium polyolivorans TaxID=2886943 RepID=A0AAW4X083_9FIRM|nr:chemotaxis protein CheA [Halanaerobium polyolivorans]MCC3145219.1 chemotaxis protein CheA [Halanaerobium polyolivorans]
MQDNGYLDLFFAEANEYIEVLNNGILTLENQPDDEDAIAAVFRAAHSLKGMAAAMGFANLTELTHQMENKLEELRAGKLVVTTELIDLLFAALDNVQLLVKQIKENEGEEPAEFNFGDLIVKLSAYSENHEKEGSSQKQDSSTEKSLTLSSEEEKELAVEKKAKEKIYQLGVSIAEADFANVRAFMVFKKLEELGRVFKSNIAKAEVEDYEEDIDELEFYFLSWLEKAEFEAELEALSNASLNYLQEVKLQDFQSSSERESGELKKTNALNSFQSNSTVRIDIAKLDKLINMVGELLINKTRLQSLNIGKSKFNEIIPQLDRLTMELHHIVMQIRMVPVGVMFSRFPRMLRDLSNDMGKDIDFIMSGQETELDRSIIDELADPLTHLLRNAVDHGIEAAEIRKEKGKTEQGKIELKAYQKGSEIIIEVVDDGAGIDADNIAAKAVEKGIISQEEVEQLDKREILDFVFHPGLSTASKVTNVSGRGVGMDIVRNTVKKLDGQISIESELGKGSRFTISLPLTLAITQALMIKIAGDVFAIPINAVSETLTMETKNIKQLRGKDCIVLREQTIPLVSAAEIFAEEDFEAPKEETDKLSVVIIKNADRQIGLIVDQLLNQQEIVIKSLGNYLQDIDCISGATIIGDGDVALILDVRDIIA